jgi:hypothetical protein
MCICAGLGQPLDMLRFLDAARQHLSLTAPAVFVLARVEGDTGGVPISLEPLAEKLVVHELQLPGKHYPNYDAFFAEDPVAQTAAACGIRIIRRNGPSADDRMFENVAVVLEPLLVHFWPIAPAYALAVLQTLMGVRVDLVVWSSSSVGADGVALPDPIEGLWRYGGLDIGDHAFPYPQEHHGAVSVAFAQAGHEFE